MSDTFIPTFKKKHGIPSVKTEIKTEVDTNSIAFKLKQKEEERKAKKITEVKKEKKCYLDDEFADYLDPRVVLFNKTKKEIEEKREKINFENWFKKYEEYLWRSYVLFSPLSPILIDFKEYSFFCFKNSTLEYEFS